MVGLSTSGERMDTRHPVDDPEFLRRLHERPHKGLEEWLDAPAHVHHVAHRMSNPPEERRKSREQFAHILQSLTISPDELVLHDTFGYGVKTAENGDRLILVWQAHTEYYSYQVWHIPSEKTAPLSFGPLAFPQYVFPLSPGAPGECTRHSGRPRPPILRRGCPSPDAGNGDLWKSSLW